LKQPADFEHLEFTKHGSRRACQGSTTVHTLVFSSCMFAKLLATDLASKRLTYRLSRLSR